MAVLNGAGHMGWVAVVVVRWHTRAHGGNMDLVVDEAWEAHGSTLIGWQFHFVGCHMGAYGGTWVG